MAEGQMHDEPRQSSFLLEARRLVKSFRRRVVVRDVSLTLGRGEIVGLLGPNGAGKTTTFSMIVGLYAPDSGRILLEDLDITTMPMYKRARHGIAYLPQEPSVFRNLTVRQNLLLVLEHQRLSRGERLQRAEQMLEELGLMHVADNPAYTLSGGERRRTEVARALLMQPKALLLDEPFSGIDPLAVAELQAMVGHIRQRGISVLITDHNVRDTLQITDRAYIINEGVLVAEGTPQEIVNNELVRKIYLGARFRMDFETADETEAPLGSPSSAGNEAQGSPTRTKESGSQSRKSRRWRRHK